MKEGLEKKQEDRAVFLLRTLSQWNHETIQNCHAERSEESTV